MRGRRLHPVPGNGYNAEDDGANDAEGDNDDPDYDADVLLPSLPVRQSLITLRVVKLCEATASVPCVGGGEEDEGRMVRGR